jgi:hypothetical protein
MRVVMIDPRDQAGEYDAPHYRVNIWRSQTACETWKLSETDLDGVLEWVAHNTDMKPYSLWVCIPETNGRVTVVRLQGIDPPAAKDTWPWWAKEVSAE